MDAADLVDLRSDTVTRPDAAMRDAMRDAVVGNAAWGEDPTVLELEEESARATGKEAALFVPSGTMGNQVAIRAHTLGASAPEIILDALSHIYLNEAAAIATIARAQVRPLTSRRGALDPAEVEAAIQPGIVLKPETSLVCLENTHNYHAGAVVPLDNVAAIRRVADDHDIPVHLDGARVFNAAVALDVPVARVCRDVDTVQFCFSKGLGAPIGSVLCGPADFIATAAKVRQALGGALRQAGVVAAPALLGLREGAKLLKEDHRRARVLAEGLANLGLPVDVAAVETNILIVDVSAHGSAHEVAHRFEKEGVGVSVIDERHVRFVTHRDVDDEGVERALAASGKIVG